MSRPFIDYSGYAAWGKCAWLWKEKYVNKVQKKWPQAQRDDALALGSLVHAGLEVYYRGKGPDIPGETIAEVGPTKECLALAQRLIFAYLQYYPNERWELNFCEQPLRFPLTETRDGLAKLDRYFYVPETTVVPSGIAGYEITLRAGWWIHEYKTKSAWVDRGEWIRQWVVKKQADFQMLALAHWLWAKNYSNGEDIRVNGLLINVIEKPKEYVPKRKCRQCNDYWPFSAWLPRDNGHACPMCGNVQQLKPVKAEERDEQVFCFRTIAERTPTQLEQSRREIAAVANLMDRVDEQPPNREACLDLSKRYGKECEFFRPHNYDLVTIGNPEYEQVKDYVGEGINA